MTLQRCFRELQWGELKIVAPSETGSASFPKGHILIGTAADHPRLVEWLKREGTKALSNPTTDEYVIFEQDGVLAVMGANTRAALYGAYQLEDLLREKEALPAGFREWGKPALNFRILHPRARGGFGSYQPGDFEFIARAGGNVALLQHDWMAEKTLFSFVPCYEFPNVTPPEVLERNRQKLTQYLEWCEQYDLSVALWLCEAVCQGGPWIRESQRAAFLDRFPAEVLSDSGTYQGKVLCLAHPLVEQAYRGMVHQLLNDFPGLEMVLVFTLDSSGELCDPEKCERHRGVSKMTQYNRLLALLAEEARNIRPRFQVCSLAWSWKFRSDPNYLKEQTALPAGAGLATLPDAEAWSFDRKLTDALREQRRVTREHGQALLGYDIFLWGDDTIFPSTELFDYPLGIAAKLKRWQALGVEGVFDQWGTQAEYLPVNAIALRQLFFHPELAEPSQALRWAEQLAKRFYGEAAGPSVWLAWQEIEAAQQIQSDHTYYWHELRPNWARVALGTPLTVEGLKVAQLAGAEPSKKDGDKDYAPNRDDVANAKALGIALQQAAEQFRSAVGHLQKALGVVSGEPQSCYQHWLPKDEKRKPLSVRQQLEKQIMAVRLQEGVQRELAHFYGAYALVKAMGADGSPTDDKKLEALRAIQTEAAVTSLAMAELLEQSGTKGTTAQQFRDRVAGLPKT